MPTQTGGIERWTGPEWDSPGLLQSQRIAAVVLLIDVKSSLCLSRWVEKRASNGKGRQHEWLIVSLRCKKAEASNMIRGGWHGCWMDSLEWVGESNACQATPWRSFAVVVVIVYSMKLELSVVSTPIGTCLWSTWRALCDKVSHSTGSEVLLACEMYELESWAVVIVRTGRTD